MSVQRAISHQHIDWRTGEAARAAYWQRFDANLAAVKRCAEWLTAQGVFVEAVDLRPASPGKPVVTVAASPLLHSLLKDSCATIKRWPEEGRTAYLWSADRHGCEIRWKEVAQ